MLLTGKAFITMAYNIAYLYGSEIFPTEVRNVGIGVAAVMEDVGCFVAPLIAGPLVLALSPVHTSNNVEATFYTVERIVQLVAFDNVASTLLLVWTGLS